MTERKQREPLFGLDMEFGEALERFIGTDPEETRKLIEQGKSEKPPEASSRKASAPF